MKRICIPAFLLLLFLLSSCRKYNDGPAFTLLTKTNRVTNDWILDIAVRETGGAIFEVTDRYPTMRLRIRKDTVIVLFSPLTEKLYGTWSFEESKETFNWAVDHDPVTFINDNSLADQDITSYDSLERFDIERLTEDDFWIIDKFGNTLRFAEE